MMLSTSQRSFLAIFVTDGEFNLMSTCQAVGILPSEALAWFRDDEFQSGLRRYEHAQLQAMGYGPLRVMRDTLDIAHSDVTEALQYASEIERAPRRVRIAIKKIKLHAIPMPDGSLQTYVKEIEMVGKEWALKQAAEWFNVAETPEVKKASQTNADDGPKRITGMVIRPPITSEEKQIEDMLS
jgi:hypothetical protein